MEEKVFDRVEKKYLITPEEKRDLLKEIKSYISKGNYHKSDIINIYFDNDNYEMISESIDWVDFKKKIRVRSYEGYDRVFLEIKTKLHGEDENIGYKRRVIEKGTDLQIAKEIDYLVTKFQLEPKVLISYQRESYKDDKDLRITFDENLKYRHHNLCLKKQKSDTIFFKDNRNIIMEVKTTGAMPLWFVKTLSKYRIYPSRFSKIGKIYQQIIDERN